MHRTRWERGKALFARALELTRRGRRALLEGERARDPGLAAEVGELVEHFEHADSALRPLEDLSAASPLPERIGPYRILSLIGRGGMGVVYEAEQEQPRRVVALKVISPSTLSPAAVRRFELEADALGRLRHPGIAQIYSAGVVDTAAGRQHFFAMERIDGVGLVEHVRELSPDVPARLGLFVKVCHAVQHAHQRGVIHRDLKPANILVDADGEPKVLDFGVARVSRPERDAATTRLTEAGGRVGTPVYMSPEQAAGDPLDLDTRSDVYALGVVLYELLTGALPYEFPSDDSDTVARTIREREPVTPSARDPRLARDLDTIVLTALAKERERRYASASELAQDVERFLRDEPIAARPPSTAYRLRKFARRHRTGLVLASGVAAALIAGVIATSVAAVRAREQARRANAFANVLREVFRAGDLSHEGPTATLSAGLDRAEAKLDELTAGDPDVEGSVRASLAAYCDQLGLRERGLAHWRRAVECLGATRGEGDADRLAAELGLAVDLARLDDSASAEELARSVVARARAALHGGHPVAREAERALARVLVQRGKLDEAEQIVAASRASGAAPDRDRDAERALDRIEMEILAWRGLTPERAARLDALYESVCGPGSPEDSLALEASAWTVEALIHGERWERAESLSARNLALHERRLGGEHPDLLAPLLARAQVLASIGGRAVEAEQALRRALALRPEPTGGARVGWARAQQLLADLLDARGETREAGALYAAAAASYEATIGIAHGLTLHCWIRYGERASASDPGVAGATLLRVVESLGEGARDVPLAAALLRRLRGSALARLGSFEDAEAEFGRAEDLIAYADVPQFVAERRRLLEARVELYAAWPDPEKLAQARAKLAIEPAAPAER